MQQQLPSYVETHAVLYLPDGTVDEAFNHHTASSMILDQGARAVAFTADGVWTRDELQARYDHELAPFDDCWGPGPTARCVECSRVFDLCDEIDADEWAYGHDCEG